MNLTGRYISFCENQNDSRLPFYAWNVLNTFYYFHYDFDLSVDFESIDLAKYNVKKNLKKPAAGAAFLRFFAKDNSIILLIGTKSYRREEGNNALDPQKRGESIKNVLTTIITQNLYINLVRKPKGILGCLITPPFLRRFFEVEGGVINQ